MERKGAGVLTSVFRKKTHTDQYLNFDSNHPARVKRGIIQCLKHRAEKTCSGGTKWKELGNLRQVFKANGYPETMVNRSLRTRSTSSNSTQTSQTLPKLLLLPYVPELSERIEKMCRPLGVKTVCRSRYTLRSSLVHVKHPREDKKKKGVIYEVPCKDCECVYIGETGRTLEKRLSEHKNAVKKQDTKNGIAVHSWTNQHQVDWEAAKTIEVEGNYWRRRVLEALHIHQQQHTSNLDCGLAINPSWLPVLNQPYRRHELEKRRKYERRVIDVEHGTFTPFVMSSSEGMGPSATVTVKRLASLMAEKTDTPYSVMLNVIRCKLSFSLVDSAIMCIRGARSSLRRPAVSFDSPVLIGGAIE